MEIRIQAGAVSLRDEGTRTEWNLPVGAFRLAQVPVTRELYREVMGRVNEGPGGPQSPFCDVSWLDALRFCNALSEQSGLSPCYRIGDDPDGLEAAWNIASDGYRLPSEGEWEYACRAGSEGVRYGDLDAIAWHAGNSEERVHDVGGKLPNRWGLHDMIGNAWEWCWDLYDPTVYGSYRVFRGGGWQDLPRSCRASRRRKSHPTLRIDDLGFRVARAA